MSDDLFDAPNQQVVRPDGSGPGDEGSGGSTPDPEPDGLSTLTKAELLDEAEARGVEVPEGATKAEVREALEGG